MKIKIDNKNKKVPKDLLEACGRNEILAKVLYNRGIHSLSDFKKTITCEEYIPYNPMEFEPVIEACKLISEALINKDKIAVYGDYDVDGITATSILVLGLKKLNADVIYHVPDRFAEGYGMNIDVVEQLYKKGTKAIITCDCGIANIDEVARAKELGMKVIVTDHHTIGEIIPNADVVINYKLLPEGNSVRDISGCATAYSLIKALYEYLGQELKDNYLDLVALSIVSDVIPLRGESRYIFKEGMKELKSPKRLGLKALMDIINLEELTIEDISFQITPRLNAVGRMASARIAVELFLADNEEKARDLALEIDRCNTDRKNIQNDIYNEAKELVETEKKNKKILILFGEHWHHGVIGIVAGKICEEYKKPCIMLSMTENGDVVGSARSTEQLNIYDTLSIFSQYLLKFGGHSGAAGLSLKFENLLKFTQALEDYADIYLGEDYSETVLVDCALPFDMVTEELLDGLKLGEPYGERFLPPKFVAPKVKILRETINKGTHHFMTLVDDTKHEVGTTLWNYGPDELLNKECTIVYDIYKDTYNGRNEVKIRIQDILFDKVEIVEDKIKFVDRRNVEISEILTEFKDCSIFYEGPVVFKPNFPVINRHHIDKVKNLVLYSLPQSNKVLNELLENTCPDCVIINYSYTPKYGKLDFQKMFMGVIKNISNNSNGVIKVEDFSDIMQTDSEFIITYSKLLADFGYFDFSWDNDKLKYVIKLKMDKKKNAYLENISTRYLKEKEEYVKYMVNSTSYYKD